MVIFRFILEAFLLLGFGALGALLGVRAGLFNISVEASIINSMFGFMYGLRAYGLWQAVLIALICGVLTAILFCALVVWLNLDDIVSGIAINMLSLGGVTLATQVLVGDKTLVVSHFRDRCHESLALAWLAAAFFLSLIMVRFFLVSSCFAPQISSVGFDAGVAKLCDIPVRLLRILMVLSGGFLCALAGIVFAVSAGEYSDSVWREGVGYMSIALVLAGRGRIHFTIAGVAAFSFVRFISIHPVFRVPSIPEQGYQILPYIVILTLFCWLGRSKRGGMSPYP